MFKSFWPKGVATLFGAGRSPKAPGTVGTLVALPVVFATSYLPPFINMALVVTCILVAIFASEHHGKGQDLKEIVIDEFVGLQVAAFLVPREWLLWILVFVLFRLLDILKPFPISHLDKNVKGGFGVVLDDLLAGLATNAFIHFVLLKYLL